MKHALLWTAALATAGCHAKFKKYAPTLGSVRTQVIVTGGPTVDLGEMEGSGTGDLGDAVAAVVNVVQAVKEVDLARRIADAVDVRQVNDAMEQSLADTLGSGPPFAWTADEKSAGALLQVEVLSYGLQVPGIGLPGVFTYELRTRIYKPDGERVYSARTECSVDAGDPKAVSVALGAVNNARQIKEMSDEDIQAAFDSVAAYCGQELVRKMRKHAG